ncbi:hypothetical protein N869_10635 [Cellulomonas bogoriensis 69B4 = DSM 16987]|uniref:DUF4349 domain-containing protein n=1 Tax=Cellulomonas bogoriensis 69B4 = DSM 16987 TaxID=1386082 RepID=A0A0A0BQQ2_9CELL|nr:hypothetical protein N869_10635 [Cellulomonas bogoriensis 69B4 = DSM 16987]
MTLAVTASLLLAGCGAGATGNDSDAPLGFMSADAREEATAGGADGDLTDAAPDAADDGGDALTRQAGVRHMVVTGTLDIEVGDPREAVRHTVNIVEMAGGLVQEREEHVGRDGEGSARVVVRLPVQDAEATLDRLEELGTVVDRTTSGEDVTDALLDLEARTRALEISIGRLEGLLERSGTVSEIVEAERVLTARQSDLEAMTARRAHLADQAALATFTVHLWSAAEDAEPAPAGFTGGVVRGWDALVATLGGLALTFGVLLPWVLFLGALGGLVLLAVRGLRRRQAATALPVASTSPAPSGPPAPGAGATP